MSSPSSSSPVPLYLQVADTLRQRIERGVWAANSLLPTLEALALEFGVARVTARQAVQLLTHEGLLLPQRGRGTLVKPAPQQRRQVKLETSLVDLGRMYESTTPEILTMDESSRMPPIRAGQGKLGERYVYMRRLHSSDDQPYSVIEIYMLDSIFALAPQAFRARAVIPTLLLQKSVDLHEATQTMTIGVAGSENARLLRVPAGAPVAQVERIFKDAQGTVLYFAEVIYRGDWVRWEINLKPTAR